MSPSKEWPSASVSSIPSLTGRFPAELLASAAMWMVCILIVALCAFKIVTSVDITWDTLAYHWPYSARLAGVCSLESCYRMSEVFEVRFLGFPKIIHYLQAGVLLIGQKFEYIGFINLAAILALCAFLRGCFRVSFPLALISFLAIPLVLIHATSHYVDLPTNVAATIALMLTYLLLAEPEAFRIRHLAGLFAASAFLANAKLQMIAPAVAIAGGALLILMVRAWRGRPPFGTGGIPRGIAWGVCVVGVFLILLNPVINTIRFGNPVYPISLTILGLALPGPEQLDQPVSISHALAGVPGPIRWVMSVLEVNAYGFRMLPWTVDQGYVTQDLPSYRMGGYNVVLVLANVAILVFRVITGRDDRRARMAAMVMFAATTVLTAFLPLAHELRYYMFWVLLLVSLNLVLCRSPRGVGILDGPSAPLYAALVVTVFLSVNLITGGHYLSTRHLTDVQGFIQGSGIAALVAKEVPDGATVCLRETAPLSYLYAPVFQSGRTYRAIEDGTTGCDVTLGTPARGRL